MVLCYTLNVYRIKDVFLASKIMAKRSFLLFIFLLVDFVMSEKRFFLDKLIIDSLTINYGINATQLMFVPLGADVDAEVYKAQTSTGLSYFVKLKQGIDNNLGVIIQELLYEGGIQQIIVPIKTKQGQPLLHLDGFTLIVYPFIEGKDGFSSNLTDEQWVLLGKALRKIHEFQIPLSIKNQIKEETYSSKWRELVQAMYAHIDSVQVFADEVATKLQAFMQEHRTEIQRLVHRAQQLAQKIKNKVPRLVLCHSDIHGGNVLISSTDGALYIVDWDQPIMAPKERDLMFVGGGVANTWNDPKEEEFFYKGYGSVEVDREILSYYRYERIVEDVAFYSQCLLLAVDGDKGREEMYRHFLGMFEVNGVVDIAFATDPEVQE